MTQSNQQYSLNYLVFRAHNSEIFEIKKIACSTALKIKKLKIKQLLEKLAWEKNEKKVVRELVDV